MGIETLIPTLNLPLAALGAAVFVGGLTMRQVFVSMIGCSIVLIGLAGGYYMPGIIGGIAVQVAGAAAELIFGRRARWAARCSAISAASSSPGVRSVHNLPGRCTEARFSEVAQLLAAPKRRSMSP
ncbi:MAG TPA: hypothetical protein VGU20_04920 [Stellaceae bacterium]|nr:hypothetical protein [Stellaceae bacterium]